MAVTLVMLIVAQAVPASTPEPRLVESQAIIYRKLCMSKAGAEIAARQWIEGASARAAAIAASERNRREAREAISAVPVDVARVERVLKGSSEANRQLASEIQRRYLVTLRQLSPQDRVLYAPEIFPIVDSRQRPSCKVEPSASPAKPKK